jgi:hypothetical protein
VNWPSNWVRRASGWGVRVRDLLLKRMPQIPGVFARVGPPCCRLAEAIEPHSESSRNSDVTDTVEFDTDVVSREFFDVYLCGSWRGTLRWSRHARATPVVVVVEEQLARRRFGANAVSRQLVDSRDTHLEIIGVVRTDAIAVMASHAS